MLIEYLNDEKALPEDDLNNLKGSTIAIDADILITLVQRGSPKKSI